MASVTIFMPTFERARYIRRAIESALGQTYEDFVLDIGDNSSSDDTEAIVREYSDPRIRYRRNPTNLGQQGNWLELIRNAETPLVGSLHDDDAWRPDFLATLVPPMLEDPTLSIAFADFAYIDENDAALPEMTADLNRTTHRDEIPAGRVGFDREAMFRLVALWNAPQVAVCSLLRRDAVMRSVFPDEMAPIYDIWLAFQMADRGEGFYYVPTCLSDVRWHSGSSTAVGWPRPEDEVFWRMIQMIGPSPLADEVAAKWAMYRWGRAGRLMASADNREESQRELRWAAPHLPLGLGVVAELAARSPLVWSGMRRIRSVRKRGG